MPTCSSCKKEKETNEFSPSPADKNSELHKRCDECRESYRDYVLYSKHNLPVGWYSAKEAEQGGKCKICNKKARLCVDHNHRTGDVRALLCTKCNLMIGYANEDVEILYAASEYISEYNRDA